MQFILQTGFSTASEVTGGGIALAGEKPKFDNVKVGYDDNSDDDIDDGDVAYTVDLPNVALCVTDLAADTAEQVIDPTLEEESWTGMLGGAGGLLYFTLQDSSDADPPETTIWASDGTAQGTRLSRLPT